MTEALPILELTEPICRSCPEKWPFPATHIATPNRTDGEITDWPVCSMHMEYAMCAGWFPIRKVGEER